MITEPFLCDDIIFEKTENISICSNEPTFEKNNI